MTFYNRSLNIQEGKENVGKIWTKDEHDQLLKELESGKNIQEISIIHKRNPKGIESRRKMIVKDLHESGKDIDIIKEITKLSDDDINIILTMQEKRQTKKSKSNDVNETIIYKLTNIEARLFRIENILEKLEVSLMAPE